MEMALIQNQIVALVMLGILVASSIALAGVDDALLSARITSIIMLVVTLPEALNDMGIGLFWLGLVLVPMILVLVPSTEDEATLPTDIIMVILSALNMLQKGGLAGGYI